MSEAATHEELAAAAQSGDRRSMERLLDALYDPVSQVCRRICGSDADDATQNAMISIVRALPKFDGRSAVTSWAFRIATNASLDELRRRSRRAEPTDLDTPQISAVMTHDDAPDLEESLADRDLLETALAELTPEFRAAVVLRDVAGMDYGEIATTLDVPIGTVRSRIARGRKHLAKTLQIGNQNGVSDVIGKEP